MTKLESLPKHWPVVINNDIMLISLNALLASGKARIETKQFNVDDIHCEKPAYIIIELE